MIKKAIILFTLQFTVGLALMAQTVVYKADLSIHPDSKNQNGCVLSIYEINQSFDFNNNIKWEFNVQEFTPTLEAEQYLATVVKKEWSITFLHKQTDEKLKAENLTKEESFINAECVFNGMIIPIEISIQKKKNKDKSVYNELSFSLTGHQVGANSDEVFLFKMILTPQ